MTKEEKILVAGICVCLGAILIPIVGFLWVGLFRVLGGN